MNGKNFAYLEHVACILNSLVEWGEPIPKSELAVLCGLSHAYAMGLLDGMQLAGLVCYEYPPSSNYVMVSVADAGLELLEGVE